MSARVQASGPPVQRVALETGVDERVKRLRSLTRRVTTESLALAEAIYREHVAGLWQHARAHDGHRFVSEEDFWEDLGVKRRTAYQLVARGRTLTNLQLPPADRGALDGVGLHKLDVLLPILDKEGTVSAARSWIAAATQLSRGVLREQVSQALGGPRRSRDPIGQRLQQILINAMPDLESRQLAEDFFRVGRDVVGSESAVAVVIAAMQEALATWHVEAVPPVATSGTAAPPEGTA